MKTATRICATILFALSLGFSGSAEAKKGGQDKGNRGHQRSSQAHAVAHQKQTVAHRGSNGRKQSAARVSNGNRHQVVARRVPASADRYVIARSSKSAKSSGRHVAARHSNRDRDYVVARRVSSGDRYRIVHRDRRHHRDGDHDHHYHHRNFGSSFYFLPTYGASYLPYHNYYNSPRYYGYSETYYEPPVADYGYGALSAEVQMALAELGYYHGAIDGIFGSQSRDALLAFQRDAGLPMTGLIDEATVAELGVS